MATFSVDVPDDQVPLIGESFAQQYDGAYSAYLTDNDINPDDLTAAELVQEQIEFTRQQVMSYINEVVKGHMVWQQEEGQPAVPDTPVNLS